MGRGKRKKSRDRASDRIAPALFAAFDAMKEEKRKEERSHQFSPPHSCGPAGEREEEGRKKGGKKHNSPVAAF